MMNVTRSGSCSRFRISFAARPTATRSRERSSSTASSSVIRSPDVARSRISTTGVRSAMLICQPSVGRSCDRRAGLRLDEAELRHGLEQPGVACELEEGVEPGALARAEAVAELLEVAREEPGRIEIGRA